MGKLVFNVIGAEAKRFIKNGSRNHSEAVAAHFIFLNADAPYCGRGGVVAPWAISLFSRSGRRIAT